MDKMVLLNSLYFRNMWVNKLQLFLIVCIVFWLSNKSVSASNQEADWSDTPYIEMIVINGDSVITIPQGYTVEELTLIHDCNNLGVRMSTSDSTIFQYYLEGFDDEWGIWTDINYKEYTRLPAGKYTFRIRYSNQNNLAGEMVIMRFKVLPAWYLSTYAIIFYIFFFILLLLTVYSQIRLKFAKNQYKLERIINSRTEELILEKDKTDNLLANVLPENTATEIIERGKATMKQYNLVTVLFSDIQGFTKISEEMSPEVLIDELDQFFVYFDSVVERLGIEKIKTIGDAYMCAGGLPEQNRTNPVEVILAALEMQKYMNKLKEEAALKGTKHWDIRIGIHTGKVIAGVVGQKKMMYDIWGDTVNTANRMESSGEVGKINISGTTFEFAKEFFVCEHRGKMIVKDKGELDMYFVNGIMPSLRDEDGNANNLFFTKLRKIKLQDIEDIVIKMFEEEAPPNLYFHSSLYISNICAQASSLAIAENISENDYINLLLAAMFLFTGYINNYDSPAESSRILAEEILSKYGFDQQIINRVVQLISNSFEEKYEELSDKILHDARYNYLGGPDYIDLTGRLFREETENGKSRTVDEWKDIQRQLLREHDFLTNSAKKTRSLTIDEQIATLGN